MNFRDALIEAAQQEVKAGKMRRLELLALRFATLNEEKMAKAEAAAIDQAVFEGHSTQEGRGAIDWMRLLDILKDWLPVLIALLK